jgi:hypothetical protein
MPSGALASTIIAIVRVTRQSGDWAGVARSSRVINPTLALARGRPACGVAGETDDPPFNAEGRATWFRSEDDYPLSLRSLIIRGRLSSGDDLSGA